MRYSSPPPKKPIPPKITKFKTGDTIVGKPDLKMDPKVLTESWWKGAKPMRSISVIPPSWYWFLMIGMSLGLVVEWTIKLWPLWLIVLNCLILWKVW